MVDRENSLWKSYRGLILLIYAVGYAVTFANLVKAQAGIIHSGGDLVRVVIEALFLSFIWPAYWILRIAG